jgi:hypothetical protein
MKPLSTIYEPKQPKEGKTRNKMEGPVSKKTNEPPKRVNHKENIKFLKCLSFVRSISNKEREGPPKRKPSLDEPSLTTTTHLDLINCS